MRGSDGRTAEITNNVNVVESNALFESKLWGNTTQEEFLASLPVYDMFPLSDWQNNLALSWYAMVSF